MTWQWVKLIVALAVCAAVPLTWFGCGYLVPDSSACEAAALVGMTECTVVAPHPMLVQINGCGKDDAAAFEISARNASGARVRAVVCCGWPFKGCTVRTP